MPPFSSPLLACATQSLPCSTPSHAIRNPALRVVSFVHMHYAAFVSMAVLSTLVLGDWKHYKRPHGGSAKPHAH